MRPVSAKTSSRTAIPLGLVFVIAGMVILLMVLSVWLLAPLAVPRDMSSKSTRLVATATIPEVLAPESLIPVGQLPTPIPGAQLSTANSLPGDPRFDFSRPVPNSSSATADGLDSVAPATEPVRLVIPSLGVDAPVQPVGVVSREEGGKSYLQALVPNGYVAGWHEASAPLGQGGNSVFSGHNNIYGKIFKDLDELNLGDRIVLYDSTRSYTYQVTRRELFEERGQPLSVRFQNAKWMLPTDEERVTLITCWPLTTNSHRLVVVATPIDGDGT